jgi:hypothetical protein
MALILKDRVKETTSTTGTGAISLGGAVANFQAFSAVLSDADTTYYAIIDVTNSDYEVGLGTYSSGGNTLARTTILESSNGGSAVSFGAGSKNVFIAYPAEKSVYLDDSNQLVINSTAVTSTPAELNLVDGSSAGTIVNSKAVVYGASGEVNATTLQIGGTSITATAAELNYLDITTLGLTEASKAATADANGVVTFDNGISEEYTAVTSTSNATTCNLQDGTNFSHTLTENTTFTFSNPASSGKVSAFTLKIVQDASASGFTVTWPAAVDWPSATAPTLTATASAVDYFVFITHDGGTTYYGFTAGQALG